MTSKSVLLGKKSDFFYVDLLSKIPRGCGLSYKAVSLFSAPVEREVELQLPMLPSVSM